MLNDKSYFSRVKINLMLYSFFIDHVKENFDPCFVIEQRGELKRPDHADLRYKCRTYARLLQHMKVLILEIVTVISAVHQ